jgi:hypothetical protein
MEPGAALNARSALTVPEPVTVPTAPPAAISETITPAPAGNQIWIAGHYSFASGQWIWIPGSWTAAPAKGAMWVEGRYDPRTRQWVEGHWEMKNSQPGTNSTGIDPR